MQAHLSIYSFYIIDEAYQHAKAIKNYKRKGKCIAGPSDNQPNRGHFEMLVDLPVQDKARSTMVNQGGSPILHWRLTT